MRSHFLYNAVNDLWYLTTHLNSNLLMGLHLIRDRKGLEVTRWSAYGNDSNYSFVSFNISSRIF